MMMSPKSNIYDLNQQSTKNAKVKASSVGAIGSKILPLKQLRDIIADIYAQKCKFDQKSRDSRQPIETME